MVKITSFVFIATLIFVFAAEAKQKKSGVKPAKKSSSQAVAQNSPKPVDESASRCDYDSNAYDQTEGVELDQASEVFMNPDAIGTTLFLESGKTYRDCVGKKPSDCGALAWPQPEDSVISKIAGEKIEYRAIYDDKCGKNTMVPFIKVKVSYPPRKYIDPADGREKLSRGIDGAVGYMDARLLKTKKFQPLYTDPSIPTEPLAVPASPEELCPVDTVPNMNTPPNKKNIWAIGYLEDFLQQKHKQQVEQTAQALRSFVGECPLDPPDSKSFQIERWKKNKTKNLYDAEVMPLLRKLKDQLPKIPKQVKNSQGQCVGSSAANNQMVNFEDLVNVDAMARTIFAEMHECIKEGSLEYPMAAAKVAKNRVEDIKNKNGNWEVFLKPTSHQATDKPLLAKALTASFQFSVWNKNDNEKDTSVLLAMCPTRYSSDKSQMHYASGKEYLDSWKGQAWPAIDKKTKEPLGLKNRVGSRDLRVWDYAMQIATEAVLYPCEFDRRTKEVTQRYYTSKMPYYANRKKGMATIEGREVKSFRCMYLWEGK